MQQWLRCCVYAHRVIMQPASSKHYFPQSNEIFALNRDARRHPESVFLLTLARNERRQHIATALDHPGGDCERWKNSAPRFTSQRCSLTHLPSLRMCNLHSLGCWLAVIAKVLCHNVAHFGMTMSLSGASLCALLFDSVQHSSRIRIIRIPRGNQSWGRILLKQSFWHTYFVF